MPPKLPGFFYDEGKGRYFRIQADNKAPPSTAEARYSRSAVNRLKHEEELSHRNYARQLQASTAVSRSKLLWDPRFSPSLAREVGMSSTLDPGHQWAGGYSIDTARRHPNPLSARILNAIYDGPTGYTIIADSTGCLCVAEKYDTFSRAVKVLPHTVDYLAERPSNGNFAAVGNVTGSVALVAIQNVISPEMERHPLLSWELETNITDFVANPVFSTPLYQLALAGGDGTIIEIHNEAARITNLPQRHGNLSGYPTSTLAVAYQSSQVLSWGYRDGGISIHDLRVNQTSMRAQHPSSIRRIVYVDDHHFLAAGIQDKLSMYDLRWCPSPNDANPSPSYLDYPGYSCYARMHGLTFDVSPFLNLIASKNDNGGIALLDLWKATKKECLHPHSPGPINAIRFMAENPRDLDVRKGVGLCLVALDNQLQRRYLGRPPGLEGDQTWAAPGWLLRDGP